MDKLIDTFCRWDHFGQGIFILIILAGLSSFVLAVIRYGVILVRGWPPPEKEEVED